MIHGGKKTIGKGGVVDHLAEVDDYFAERADEPVNAAPRASDLLSREEEVRRLKAYLAHLQSQISNPVNKQDVSARQSWRTRGRDVSIVSLVVSAGIGALLVRRLLKRF